MNRKLGKIVFMIYSSKCFLSLLPSIIEYNQKLTIYLLATKTHKLITSGDLCCCQKYKKNKYAYSFLSNTCKYISVYGSRFADYLQGM